MILFIFLNIRNVVKTQKYRSKIYLYLHLIQLAVGILQF